VRATVADETKRRAFDNWYSREHLPQAMEAFGSKKAWRFWSEEDPAIHQAVYRFPDRGALDRAVGSDKMKQLVADFDRDWPGIPRKRDIQIMVEEVGV
jgi:hypothetical protein